MTTRYYNIYNRTIYDLLRNQSAGETVEVNDKNYDEETRRIVAEQQQLFETELKKYEDRIKIETEKQRQENIKLGVEAKLINDEKEALLQKLKNDEIYYTKRAEDFLKLGKYYGYMQGNLPVISRDYGRQSVNYKDSIDKAIQVLRENGEDAIIENDELLIPLHKESLNDNIGRLYELQKNIKDVNQKSSLLDSTYYSRKAASTERTYKNLEEKYNKILIEKSDLKKIQDTDELKKQLIIKNKEDEEKISNELKKQKIKIDESRGKIIDKIDSEIKKSVNLESTLLGGIQVGTYSKFYPPFGYAKSLNPNTFTNEELYKTLSTKASVLLNQYKKK